ncbi:MAG: hypothetical protein ACFE8A_06620 [Candidatus Hodarchaeota archaeon]
MAKTRSEDTLILNVFTPGITFMKLVYNAVEHFCEIKKKIDESSRFNIILFQEDGPNYLENFTLNPKNILIALKSLEPVIIRGNIGGGIFVAISFIIDVFKKISEKTFRLIILTDSGSPRISKLYMPILENLIAQVKDMPFFIDIIRLNVDDYEEDAKLMNLVRICNGGIHEINSINLLADILELLALKREIEVSSLIEGKDYIIPPENQPFYINLAEIPIEIEEPEVCSICFQKDDRSIVKCPNCDIIAHKACWALWTTKSSIGISHVFRCHNCYNLIKLDKDFVQRMKLAKKVELAQILPEKNLEDIHDYLISLEAGEVPKIVSAETPMANPKTFESIGNLDDESEEVPIPEFGDDEWKFMLCPYCHKMITSGHKRCPNCHRTFK